MVLSLSDLVDLLRGPAAYQRRATDPSVVASACSTAPSRDRVTLSPEAREHHVEPVGEVNEK